MKAGKSQTKGLSGSVSGNFLHLRCFCDGDEVSGRLKNMMVVDVRRKQSKPWTRLVEQLMA